MTTTTPDPITNNAKRSSIDNGPVRLQPAAAIEHAIAHACEAITTQLRDAYQSAYQQRLTTNRRPRNDEWIWPDQTACEDLRLALPDLITTHLPGTELIAWDDPHPRVIDSTWQHPTGYQIDVFWDYHPNWTIGDPTAITVTHNHPATQQNDST